MDSTGSARYLLVVATIAVAIPLDCAAPVFSVSFSSPGKTGDSDRSSLLTKLPLPELPKISVIFDSGKDQSPQPSTTNSLDNNQQESYQPPQQQPQQSRPKPTVDEQPDGQDPHQPLQNASVTTSPRPKLETTTNDRSNFIAPSVSCADGEKLNENKVCVRAFSNPESK